MNAGPYRCMPPERLRALCRDGTFGGTTAGASSGFVQANLVMLPRDFAHDFERFCRANPRPCPLIDLTSPGVYEPVATAPGADLRTDLPRYRVFRDGVCVDRPFDLRSLIGPKEGDLGIAPGETLASFLLGCSFTFEQALIAAGLPIRHIEEGSNVPMYRTNIACVPAGAFEGPLVVSMRPMTPEHAGRASAITARFSLAHGAPVHVGDPAEIGIADIKEPDYGDPVKIHLGEVPVFWACGVTPLEAIQRAKPLLAITHEPGHMFVTDWTDEALLTMR